MNQYKIIVVDGIKIPEHRYVAESFLGRKLKKGEVVHHINGDKADNRIENLQVMTMAEHTRLHKIGKHPIHKKQTKKHFLFKNLKAEMARKSLDIPTLAKACGMNSNTLYRKCNGETPFYLDEVIAIRNFLELDMLVDELFRKEA